MSTGQGSRVRIQGPGSRVQIQGPGSRVRVQVPKYGSRFPSTDPLLGIHLGPGSRVRIHFPEYGFWEKKGKIRHHL